MNLSVYYDLENINGNKSPHTSRGVLKLSIVEDEPDMRKALKKGFFKKRFLVDTEEDGEEGSCMMIRL